MVTSQGLANEHIAERFPSRNSDRLAKTMTTVIIAVMRRKRLTIVHPPQVFGDISSFVGFVSENNLMSKCI